MTLFILLIFSLPVFGEIENKQVKEALQKAANNDKHPVVRTVANTSLKDLEKLK